MIRTAIRRYVVLALTIGAMAVAQAVPAFAQGASDQQQPRNYDTAKAAYLRAKPQPSLKGMSEVDQLWAIDQIKQLMLRYGRCISQKDWQCVRALFTPDFYYLDPPYRVYGPEGFIEEMHRAGTYDRVFTVDHMHGAEIQMLSPTTARGIVAADFTFYRPFGDSFPVTGTEVVKPGQQTHTPTYYYQTYEKVGGQWKIKTEDHVSFDLRRDFSAYTTTQDCAYASADGVPASERVCTPRK